MQAEGIRRNDRCDVYNDHGKIVGGWIATEDAKDDGKGGVWFDVLLHDGSTDTAHFRVGDQVLLTWGAGPKITDYAIDLVGEQQRRAEQKPNPVDSFPTPRYPEGTPEYEAYAAELRAELAKFANHEPPYDGDRDERDRQIGRLKPWTARDAGFGL